MNNTQRKQKGRAMRKREIKGYKIYEYAGKKYFPVGVLYITKEEAEKAKRSYKDKVKPIYK